ncbi:unnamed protein product [Prunus armeniaca]|uniref:Uncharacterized protein n=1 Tax=Prunus armeniaca TaxID=36596 RepID=A0A6J5VLH0_PRUAR|nr:hypothetical protein GBA52_015482 [Prunus armeniaca]CAB4263335.1 unnamed protein product [Prunus armeniaca]CAB4263396.1 unnamed protein product [Prunus armeniaca]CAB4279766.1 unnamed protein product [Prunus armeniaca]CAB4289990.1 unnamed protein product [Prunus armeniaca]
MDPRLYASGTDLDAVENGKKTSAKKRSLPARRKISGHRLLLTLVWRSQLASWFLKSVYSGSISREELPTSHTSGDALMDHLYGTEYASCSS